MRKPLIAITIAIWANAASAGYETGGSLLQECMSSHPWCFGYIIGVVDSIEGHRVCLPPAISIGRVEGMVVGFLHAHKELHDRTAAGLIAQALSAAFPCNR